MSEIKYGLISKMDGKTIEATLSTISIYFPHEKINTCEVGTFDGQTSRGINEWFLQFNIEHKHTAIDNEKDKPILKPFPECSLIIGNSNEVYNQLQDNSQHFIFIDGCHCFAHVISDFFCYAPKVKKGGYLAFHDTGKHIKPFTDFQHGDEKNPDAYISVRKALIEICIMDEPPEYLKHTPFPYLRPEWELFLDKADETDRCGGISVFKKMY